MDNGIIFSNINMANADVTHSKNSVKSFRSCTLIIQFPSVLNAIAHSWSDYYYYYYLLLLLLLILY